MITIYLYFLYIVLLIFKNNVFGKDIEIKYKDNFLNIVDIIKNNQNAGELNLKFTDNYYKFTELAMSDVFSIIITPQTNITLVGNNDGTVFDFDYDRRGTFKISNSDNKGYIVKFENITFENFCFKSFISGAYLIYIESNTMNFYTQFKNCIFRNNNLWLFNIAIKYNKNDYNNPSLYFNNCKF